MDDGDGPSDNAAAVLARLCEWKRAAPDSSPSCASAVDPPPTKRPRRREPTEAKVARFRTVCAAELAKLREPGAVPPALAVTAPMPAPALTSASASDSEHAPGGGGGGGDLGVLGRLLARSSRQRDDAMMPADAMDAQTGAEDEDEDEDECAMRPMEFLREVLEREVRERSDGEPAMTVGDVLAGVVDPDRDETMLDAGAASKGKGKGKGTTRARAKAKAKGKGKGKRMQMPLVDIERSVLTTWYEKGGGRNAFSAILAEGERCAREASEGASRSRIFMRRNALIWPEHVAPYLFEAVARLGERPCVRAERCAAYLYMPHPATGARDRGVVLREFLDDLEHERFRKTGALPERRGRCIACLRHDNHRAYTVLPLRNEVPPDIGHYHPVGVPGGYRLDKTLVPRHGGEQIMPVRHFSTDEYVPVTERSASSGSCSGSGAETGAGADAAELVRGYAEELRVFSMRDLGTMATPRVAPPTTSNSGIAPYYQCVATTRPARFYDVLTRQLDTTYRFAADGMEDSRTERRLRHVVFGSFSRHCHKLRQAIAMSAACRIRARGELLSRVTLSDEWATAARPEPLADHIVAHACMARLHAARSVCEQARARLRTARSRRTNRAKQFTATLAAVIDKLGEFCRGHRDLRDLLIDRMARHQPVDDRTLLGEAAAATGAHTLGDYDPDAFRYRLSNADTRAGCEERVSVVRWPSPQEILAEAIPPATVLLAPRGLTGRPMYPREVFVDFWETVLAVRGRAGAWIAALHDECGGFADLVPPRAVVRDAARWRSMARARTHTIVAALLARVHCGEDASNGLPEYERSLFVNTHLDLIEALDWRCERALSDEALQVRNGVLEAAYPFATCMLHEGDAAPLAAALNRVGFFDTKVATPERNRSWLHMFLKAAPRCCEVRASGGIIRGTFARDRACAEWFLRCLELSLTGALRRVETRLPAMAALAVRALVRLLRADRAALAAFVCDQQVLCKHVLREQMLLLLERNPVMAAVLHERCPWFQKFREHVAAFMDAARARFCRTRSLQSEREYKELEVETRRSTGWNGRVYRWYKRMYADYMSRAADECDAKIAAAAGAPVAAAGLVDADKLDLIRRCAWAEAKRLLSGCSAAGTEARRRPGRVDIDRDCQLLALFGMRERALTVARALYQGYARFGGHKDLERHLHCLAPDEYAHLTAYYRALADAQRLRMVPIACARWNNDVLDAMRAKFGYARREDVPRGQLMFVVSRCCHTIATQLAACGELTPAKLSGCSSITRCISTGLLTCVGSKEVRRKTRGNAKGGGGGGGGGGGAAKRAGPRPSGGRARTAAGQARACADTSATELFVFGHLVVPEKYRERRELARMNKLPCVLTPCCGTWMRYDHGCWGANGYQCASCAVMRDTDPTERWCIVCAVSGSGLCRRGQHASKRSAAKPSLATTKAPVPAGLSAVTIFDDVTSMQLQTVALCADCRKHCLPREFRRVGDASASASASASTATWWPALSLLHHWHVRWVHRAMRRKYR